MSRVDLWFDHRQAGKLTRSIFRRGAVHLRPDDKLSDLYSQATVRLT